MIENFNYSRTGSLLAQPELPSDLIPIPVFCPAKSIEIDGAAPVGAAILHVLTRIENEVRALRAQSATQNASAVPFEGAMAMLGCKRSQVFKLLDERRLERAPKIGRTIMITVASIEALLAEGIPPKVGQRSRSKPRRTRGTKATPVAPVGSCSAPEPRALGAAILRLPL
ncbi:DNA-binding protein [Corallococcus sp. CA047B]|uniref:DNA-binding protein n=1 Tax=Corallococcus sp. CA047B TaxID=2316729 RepID=UPI000EA343C2|nr:DNA-binding protein [Corallococcus sp. CA047B]RKH08465.1 DNA-binding protein [Corallococcus sp. CA047B]